MPFDIGLGLMLGVLINTVSGIDYKISLLIGVVACLLPDLDYVYKATITKKLPHGDHRDGLHYPLIFIPAVGLIGYLINPYIGLGLALGALVHFIHDSIGVGWGVKWLYPFSKKSYAFLYRANLESEKEMPKKLFYSWSDAERNVLMKKFGDPNWIKHIYFKPHIYGIMEYTVFIIGLFVAINNN
jgi:hypothetical protein